MPLIYLMRKANAGEKDNLRNILEGEVVSENDLAYTLGLAIGLASSLSFAVRWHGDRPAVLWEVDGPPMPLSHGEWSTGQLSGEALWAPVTINIAADSPSFS